MIKNADELKVVIKDYIYSQLKDQNFKFAFKDIVKKELKSSLFFQSGDFFNSEAYNTIKNRIILNIKSLASNESFKNKLCNILEEKFVSLEKSQATIASVVPSSFLNSIKVYVYNNSPEIASSIKTMINSENAQKKLKKEIATAIGGMNPMIAKFIDANMIYGKLLTGINSYVDSPDNVMDFVNAINEMVDNFSNKQIGEFLVYFPAQGRNIMIKSISNNLLDNILSNESMNLISDKIDETLRDSSNISAAINGLIESDALDVFLEELYDKVLKNNEFKVLCDSLSSSLIDKILSMPLKDILN